MLFELRLTVDDRPGSLAALTRVLADNSVDIREIDFLGSLVGNAVDNLLIDCSEAQAEALKPRLRALPGFELLSLRRATRPGGTQPHLDLLLALAQPLRQALASVTDLSLAAFSADWAMTFAVGDTSAPVYRTTAAPTLSWGGWVPTRAMRIMPGNYTATRTVPYEAMQAPLGSAHVLLVGRSPGPAFHELEVVRCNRVIEIAGAFLGISPFAGAWSATRT